MGGGIGGRGAGFRVPQAVMSPPNPPSAPCAPRRPRKPVRPAVFVSSRPDKNLNRPSSGSLLLLGRKLRRKLELGTRQVLIGPDLGPVPRILNDLQTRAPVVRNGRRKGGAKGAGRLLRRLANTGATQPPQTPNPPQGEGNEPQRAPDLVADGGDEKVVEDGPSVSSSSEPRRKPCLSQTPRKQFRRSSPLCF